MLADWNYSTLVHGGAAGRQFGHIFCSLEEKNWRKVELLAYILLEKIFGNFDDYWTVTTGVRLCKHRVVIEMEGWMATVINLIIFMSNYTTV